MELASSWDEFSSHAIVNPTRAANPSNVADYLRRGYHWRRHEASLNQYAQFTTVMIDGAQAHFLPTDAENARLERLRLSTGGFKEWTYAAEAPDDAVDRDQILTGTAASQPAWRYSRVTTLSAATEKAAMRRFFRLVR